jgi:hypothetical protein
MWYCYARYKPLVLVLILSRTPSRRNIKLTICFCQHLLKDHYHSYY